jgi:hypothetical protein
MRAFIIFCAILCVAPGSRGVAQSILHPWQIIDEGGGRSTASTVVLHSSVGHPMAGRMSVASDVLTGGYVSGLEQYRSEYVPATVAVAAGWNMISLPLLLGDARTAAVFPSATSLAYDYASGMGYDSAAALTFGRGYWLKFSLDQNVPVMGFRKIEDTIEVSQGWNIIGSVSGVTDVATIVQDPSGIVRSPYFGFGSSGYTAVSTIDPGKSVWVKVSQSGTLRLESTARMLRTVPRAVSRMRATGYHLENPK